MVLRNSSIWVLFVRSAGEGYMACFTTKIASSYTRIARTGLYDGKQIPRYDAIKVTGGLVSLRRECLEQRAYPLVA